MRRSHAALAMMLALAVAACGGGDSGGGGNGPVTASVEVPSVVGELPGVGNVLFGTSYDATTLGVPEPFTNVKQGTTPLFVVGRTMAPVDPTGVTVQIGQGSNAYKARPILASDKPAQAQLFAADVAADNLPPGTWIVNFLSQRGRIIASGYLVVEK
jgi:hypothetical protein